MYLRIVKLFLRFAIAAGFLSAVADRFGIWNYHLAWGNWNNFVNYTKILNPWANEGVAQFLAVFSTACEIIFGCFLLAGFKTELVAKLSGFLLLAFALSMTFTTGLKTALDASVFAASAGSFMMGAIQEKYFELDNLLSKKTGKPNNMD